MNDNLILRKNYSKSDLETEEVFPSREIGGNISVKSERLLESKTIGKTIDLVSQRLLQDEKKVNAMEVKETAKSPERIFDDLICQLLGEIRDGEIKDLAKIEVHQILVKAMHQAKSREKQNARYTSTTPSTLFIINSISNV